MAVLEDRKGILVEIGYEALLIVEYNGVQDDFFYALLEDEPACVAGVRGLGRRRVR